MRENSQADEDWKWTSNCDHNGSFQVVATGDYYYLRYCQECGASWYLNYIDTPNGRRRYWERIVEEGEIR